MLVAGTPHCTPQSPCTASLAAAHPSFCLCMDMAAHCSMHMVPCSTGNPSLQLSCALVQHCMTCGLLLPLTLADERVSTELKKQIIQARTAKKLTQAQLAQVRCENSL